MNIDENTFLDKYISHLNANQQKAVQTVDGPILLLAVPGSGKTTVLVNRLGYGMILMLNNHGVLVEDEDIKPCIDFFMKTTDPALYEED